MPFSRGKSLIAALILLLLFIRPAQAQDPRWQGRIKTLARGGAVTVADQTGRFIFALNPDKPMVPASTIKVLTAAAALDALGPDYKFITEFRLSPQNDLFVVGRGDPYLVSEELAEIAKKLKSKGLNQVNNIFLDDSFFPQGLVLDGTNNSLNPYDAYNGALCVNFNTIFTRIGPGRRVISAEPQTPLTDLARKLALESGARGKVRFSLAQDPETCPRYAGELLKAFLEMAGTTVRGRILTAREDPEQFPLFYRHCSSKNLCWILLQMLEYSNNFVANQIFLTMGAEKYGPPASLEKSRWAITFYLRAHGIRPPHIEEGSGISRLTRITAARMTSILKLFEPYRFLLTAEGQAWFKTGTLSDVKSIAGFLEPGDRPPLTFVIFLGGRRVGFQTRERILTLLKENLL